MPAQNQAVFGFCMKLVVEGLPSDMYISGETFFLSAYEILTFHILESYIYEMLKSSLTVDGELDDYLENQHVLSGTRSVFSLAELLLTSTAGIGK